MMTDQYRQVIAEESAALVDAARRAGPLAPIAGCPGWSVNDLLDHVASACDFWAWAVETRASDRSTYVARVDPEPTTPIGRLEHLAELTLRRAVDLVAALWSARVDAGKGDVVQTWAGPQPIGWVARRVAHELAMHRVDVERAAANDHRLAPDLAADGIDELLTVFAPTGSEALAGTVHLHCTDTAGEWTATFGADGSYAVAREHAKGDVALRGPAHDLLLALWGRAPLAEIDVFGAAGLAQAFVDSVPSD